MKSKNDHIRLRVLEIFLRTQGKKRGYYDKQEVYVTTLWQKIIPSPAPWPIIISVEGLPKSLEPYFL